MDSGGPRDRQDFINCRLDNFPSIRARRDLAILRAAQRGDGVECAIPHQLSPELALDILRNAAWDLGARKKCRETLRLLVFRPDDQITAAHMFHAAGFGY